MPLEIMPNDEGVVFTVKVKPRASRTKVLGEKMGMLEVALAAPPVDGAANAELISLLAKCFRVAKSSVRIVAGDASRLKRVSIRGVDDQHVMAIVP